jgi:hypothetical protein
MSFEWLDSPPARQDGSDRRAKVAAEELAHRAGTLFRLGFSQADATKRLCQRVAWEHESNRPAALSDDAVAKIVADTYARRPGW